jgi:hypothetical protein
MTSSGKGDWAEFEDSPLVDTNVGRDDEGMTSSIGEDWVMVEAGAASELVDEMSGGWEQVRFVAGCVLLKVLDVVMLFSLISDEMIELSEGFMLLSADASDCGVEGGVLVFSSGSPVGDESDSELGATDGPTFSSAEPFRYAA